MKKLGILCHVSSLPSEFGIGDLGKTSRNFIKFLSKNKFDIWQILPINVTNEFNCPYSTIYSFAIDPMLVDPIDLLEKKLISKKDKNVFKKFKNTHKVEYSELKKKKQILLDIAYSNITNEIKENVNNFVKKKPYIKDYSVFVSMLNHLNIRDWRLIPNELQDKKSKEYKKFVKEHAFEIEKQEFAQYILFEQWQETLRYAHQHGIKILGDVPIYPDKNSLDVYLDKELYKLDKKYNPRVTGGVPPDDFCKDGQNWGTCIYDWDKLEKNNFDYYIEKLQRMLENCDILRLDHFAGYVEHYEVNNKDFSKSKWVKGGGIPLFEQISKRCGLENFVIEDLGALTNDCKNIKKKYNLIGMHILQFSMNNPDFSPEKINQNCIYYLGTHDNNTFMGYLKSLSATKKKALCKMINIPFGSDEEILINAIKSMIKSEAGYVILQLQDMLMQPESERMNIPGIAEGVWDYKAPFKYKKKFKNTMKKVFDD